MQLTGRRRLAEVVSWAHDGDGRGPVGMHFHRARVGYDASPTYKRLVAAGGQHGVACGDYGCTPRSSEPENGADSRRVGLAGKVRPPSDWGRERDRRGRQALGCFKAGDRRRHVQQGPCSPAEQLRDWTGELRSAESDGRLQPAAPASRLGETGALSLRRQRVARHQPTAKPGAPCARTAGTGSATTDGQRSTYWTGPAAQVAPASMRVLPEPGRRS